SASRSAGEFEEQASLDSRRKKKEPNHKQQPKQLRRRLETIVRSSEQRSNAESNRKDTDREAINHPPVRVSVRKAKSDERKRDAKPSHGMECPPESELKWLGDAVHAVILPKPQASGG